MSDFVIFYARSTPKQGEQVRQAERSLNYTGWRDNLLKCSVDAIGHCALASPWRNRWKSFKAPRCSPAD